MKVTSAETLKALREARERHGSWSSVLEHAQRGEDGVLRIPKASATTEDQTQAARQAG